MSYTLKRAEVVREEAKARILQAGGDSECWQLVLREPTPVWPVPGSNIQVAPQPQCGLRLWDPGVPHTGEGSQGHLPVASRRPQRRPLLLCPTVPGDGAVDAVASDARGLRVGEGHGPGAVGLRSARPHLAPSHVQGHQHRVSNVSIAAAGAVEDAS